MCGGGAEEDCVQPEDIQELVAYLEPLARTRSRELRVDQLAQGLQEAEGGLAHCRLLTLLRARLRDAHANFISRPVQKTDNFFS
jgi:hypothetical protein